MSDIDFSSFNPRSFEQFAQALAGGVLGDGLLVFGDGPDGGREATFRGRVQYPSAMENWTGLIVVQAKFRIRPTDDGKDADWLAAQIAGEAKRIGSLAEQPDYYLLITNVRLSGVDEKRRKGGQRKASDAFERHLAPLGVKAMHVWHNEKIATLLDAQPDLLRSYKAWISPREVLSSLYDAIAASVPDFEHAMLRLLQRELREQRSTRLQQAGHVDDAATPLESVFVDLPCGAPDFEVEKRFRLLSDIKPDGGHGKLLSDLLALTSLKLDPQTVALSFPTADGPAPMRHLVMGGPGQGKSTISQFLAQVCRARLLQIESPQRLTAEVKPILNAINERMKALSLPARGLCRYPIRIDLPAFADALSIADRDETSLSLFEFIANRISLSASIKLNVGLMRKWLAAYPWLLILDGLDEVPPSGNRKRLLSAITDFWDEATPVNADVAMIITTRPQGYNDDLDPNLYMRHDMAKLDPAQALEYARGVAMLKLPEAERRDRVLGRLELAASNPTTALLMVSPLQVAILLQLVDQRGSAPTDRWTLFDEYLSVVIKREQEKQGEAGRVVKDHAFVIDGLLRRAGLLLHVEAERGGGAHAFLSASRLQSLARDVLVEEGYVGGELERLVDEITEAATDRLVFLEQRVEGRFEFEVRSLQEFMAAAELMSGDDTKVGERLHAIAGRNHWQHVYRIAASKAFASRDAAKYRDTVIAAGLALEAEDHACKVTRRGGALALELLVDGVGHDQPRYRYLLAEQAMNLVELGPHSIDNRLIEIILGMDVATALSLLDARLTSCTSEENVAAWYMLFKLIGTRADLADRMAADRWPRDTSQGLDIAAGAGPAPFGSLANDLVSQAIESRKPEDVGAALGHAARTGSGHNHASLFKQFPYLAILSKERSSFQLELGFIEQPSPTMKLRVSTVDGSDVDEFASFPDTESWRVLEPIRRFLINPTVDLLAGFVESLEREDIRTSSRYVTLPWQLDSALMMSYDQVSIADYATSVRSGKLGGPDDWARAESRWRASGITERDMDLWTQGCFFDDDVAHIGAPYAAYLSLSLNTDTDGDWLLTLIRKLAMSGDTGPAYLMRRLAGFAAGEVVTEEMLSVREVECILSKSAVGDISLQPEIISIISPEALKEDHVLQLIADRALDHQFMTSDDDSELDIDLAYIIIKRRFDEGTLRFALALCALRPAKLHTLAITLAPELSAVPDTENSPAIVLFRYVAGMTGVVQVIEACLSNGEDTYEAKALLTLAHQSTAFEADAEAILIALITKLDKRKSVVRIEAISALKRVLDQKGSGLFAPELWEQLRLPSSLFVLLGRDRAAGFIGGIELGG